ncbi:MAG: tRNA (guanosine(37)-N1)-methyltransferase TrmD [Candidatus Sungbacteria bacterium RIFCSPLOWO2_01_FULL_60_25]|uniref:tRNA (guanine-N(1)-)-methyltransferase n=1 Tax=Candidatus Sungbacteria bacterium RIFCSPLOWO2_01_FULL_60_25 TaxID=1802281 RepID=A0A1G2LDQ4_9BACT|nr:MAG: tRNA (guanosine(37)-N1)-methyltransferase TrmD [Candidatus Sungbacteria bacterium RIFCSPLOWO2_01_FULL_60_25]
MRFDVITIFPDAFTSYLDTSILRRAREKRLIEVRFRNPRDFAVDKRRTVDGKPYGGGAGMVMMAEPIIKAVQTALKGNKKQAARNKKTLVVLLSAKGKPFDQRMAYDWARKYERLILISGRYEGIDERVKIALKAEEISVGPYVLTDGDVAAMAIISAVGRLLSGVISSASLQEESFGGRAPKDRVVGSAEYPQYTRPEVLQWKGRRYRVPRVLTSGNHEKVAEWRKRFMQKSKA